VTVHVDDTVEWKNDGIVPHTATADGVAKSLLSIFGATCKGARGATSHGRKARTTVPAHSTGR
jgi:plastocyanin